MPTGLQGWLRTMVVVSGVLLWPSSSAPLVVRKRRHHAGEVQNVGATPQQIQRDIPGRYLVVGCLC
eukprot:5582131-Amphidinium_carterae.2